MGVRDNSAQYRKMSETPVPRLVSALAVPSTITMLITSVYNMADTFFVSQLGNSATGAVGVIFSLMAIIQAIGFMLGMGSNSLVSRHLGANEQEKADITASVGFFFRSDHRPGADGSRLAVSYRAGVPSGRQRDHRP